MAGFEFLLAGRTLADRYRLEAVIGRGGMGAVFRAADLRLDRPVAVKVVATHEDDGRVRARFRREAQSAARIRHPHVVTVFDFGTDPELGLDFLVMELLEGEDLSRRVARQGALPLASGLAVLRDVTEGLAAGHRLGLVHRDVKPGNVFLVAGAEPPRAVLLDFGIAKSHAEEDDTHTALTRVGGAAPHSPGFAAPEQLRGDAQLSPACDIFSLAATAYYALCGERVYTPQQLQALADGEALAVVPLSEKLDGVPAEVDRAIGQALQPDPAARPGDADAFLAMLGGAPAPPMRASVPIPPPPDGLPSGPVTVEHAPALLPAKRRSPWVWPLIGVGAVSAAVLLALPGPRSGAPVPVAPVVTDTTAVLDSAALAAARADSVERARARRDSIRRAREDSVRLATAVAESARAESVAVAPTPVPTPPAPETGAYDLASLDRRPSLANRGEMRRVAMRYYPRQLYEAGVEGRVEVALVIGADGRPEPGSIRVLSADHAEFSEAALQIAEHLRFRPGQVGGRRVRVATSMPIDFRVGN